MKKIVLFICFITIVSLGLASLSIFHEKVPLPITFSDQEPQTPDQRSKYSDCIDSVDLSSYLKKGSKERPDSHNNFMMMDDSLEKYGQSMDSVVNNLNALEAHLFLHAAYKKFKEALQTDSLSHAEVYYHLGAMQICYDHDKSLNSDSDGLAKNSN